MASIYETGGAGLREFNWYESFGRYRVSWGAIFAGVVVALVSQLVLTLLGLGIGLGLATGMPGIGAGIWTLCAALISLFLGGLVSARLSAFTSPMRGLLHGIVMWGMASLIAFYLMTSALGFLISGAANVIGQGLTSSAAGITAMVPGGQPAEFFMGQIRDMLKPGATDTQGLLSSMSKLFTQEGIADPANRSAVVNQLVANTTMTEAQANSTVDAWVSSYAQLRAGVSSAAEETARVLSKASLFGFAALVLGACAAGFGGWIGSRREIEAIRRERESIKKTAA